MIDYTGYEVETVITFWQIVQIGFVSLLYLAGCQKVFTLDS
jgi:hypothetical protein